MEKDCHRRVFNKMVTLYLPRHHFHIYEFIHELEESEKQKERWVQEGEKDLKVTAVLPSEIDRKNIFEKEDFIG